ncbi:MAG: hypothetical protein DRI56_11165 [Chloroflexota bacterium]|nr:MAG: hypothetical protein DRI56_11165 [Chloroflexota bacterium]
MLTVTLYTREDCHLCNQVEDDLASLQEEHPHRLVRIDIEKEGLLQKYGAEIPVVEIGPYQIKAPFERKTLAMTLGAARDRAEHLESVEDDTYRQRKERGQKISLVDRFFYWFSKHYMIFFNLFVFLYVGLAFMAPVMQHAGLTAPARVTYAVYSKLCHQLAYRSWFLYGEQIAYPRETAGVTALTPYGEATGLDPDDLQAAREFIGNPQLGYKVAFCQRDVGIYSGLLLFGLVFAVFRHKIKPLSFWGLLLLGLAPIALDGVSQLVSQLFAQLPWNFIPYRESTPFLRTLTGLMFGASIAWFGYPVIEEGMVDTRKIMAVKLAALRKEGQ